MFAIQSVGKVQANRAGKKLNKETTNRSDEETVQELTRVFFHVCVISLCHQGHDKEPQNYTFIKYSIFVLSK